MVTAPPPQNIFLGPGSGLKAGASIEEAAESFEALLIYYMLKQMKPSEQETIFGPKSHARQLFEEMQMEALANHLATRRAFGIANLLIRELGHGS